MLRRSAHAAAAALAVLAVAACAGSSQTFDTTGGSPPPIPFTMQPPVSAAGFVGSFGVDHITLDPDGVYVCLLRRGDDLADLRERYNPRPSP